MIQLGQWSHKEWPWSLCITGKSISFICRTTKKAGSVFLFLSYTMSCKQGRGYQAADIRYLSQSSFTSWMTDQSLLGLCTLVNELIESMLSVGSRLPPHYWSSGVIHTSPRTCHTLAIRLHVSLKFNITRGWGVYRLIPRHGKHQPVESKLQIGANTETLSGTDNLMAQLSHIYRSHVYLVIR